MNKLKEIKRLKTLASKYELENRQILDKYSMCQLASIYNGIGPDCFPDWLRAFVSTLHPSLEVPSLIHDVEWHESDGTVDGFTQSNERFQRNGIKVAKGEFAWFNPRRWIVINQARRFSKYCQLFGRTGWLKCYEKATNAKKQE